MIPEKRVRQGRKVEDGNVRGYPRKMWQLIVLLEMI
jgi:hypothetical protein